MAETRPEWAHDLYAAHHRKTCDHKKGDNCGYEGSLWFRLGDGWARETYDGRRVIVYQDGRVLEIAASRVTTPP